VLWWAECYFVGLAPVLNNRLMVDIQRIIRGRDLISKSMPTLSRIGYGSKNISIS
jgi:hypothetical protein